MTPPRPHERRAHTQPPNLRGAKSSADSPETLRRSSWRPTQSPSKPKKSNKITTMNVEVLFGSDSYDESEFEIEETVC